MCSDFRLQSYIPHYFYQAAFDIHPHLIEEDGYQPKFKDFGLEYDPNWKPVLQILICNEDSRLEKAWLKLSKMVNKKHNDSPEFNMTTFGNELYRSLYRCYRGPSDIERQPHPVRKRESKKIIKHIDEILLSIDDSYLDAPALCFYETDHNIWPPLLLKYEMKEFDHLPGYDPRSAIPTIHKAPCVPWCRNLLANFRNAA